MESQAALLPSVPTTAPDFSAMLGVTIAYARPDRVLGEMKISAHHLTPAGTIHLGAVIGFAEELATRGAALSRAAAGKAAVTFETKTNFYKPCRTEVLGGEAAPLHTGDGLMVWQTSIYDAAGKVTAVLSQTQLLVDEPAPTTSQSALAAGKVELLRTNGTATNAKGKKSGPAVSVVEERREQIAAAACEVIARKGFANASIREIAEAAGLHVPTLYQYVTSKDEVLELVYSWAMARLRIDVYEAAEGLPTAREKLLALLSAQVANGDRYKHKVGVLNRELKSLSPKARMRVLQDYQQLLGRIAELIAEGVKNGEFRDVEPGLVANFLEAMCDVWPLRQFAVGPFGLAAFQREMGAFIDAGLLPNEAMQKKITAGTL